MTKLKTNLVIRASQYIFNMLQEKYPLQSENTGVLTTDLCSQ